MSDDPLDIIDWERNWAAVWRSGRGGYLHPIHHRDPIQLQQLIGVDTQKRKLCRNTEMFLQRNGGNNVLLWGSRGCGKSSLIKALLNQYGPLGLRLIQFDQQDLHRLPEVVDDIRALEQRFIIFCDDFTFNGDDHHYRHLKSVLEGSIEIAPENVLIYATSNRRHLLPETMQDNLQSSMVAGELHLSDALEEKLALADRFGLWLSFYPNNQDSYLAIVDSYFGDQQIDRQKLHADAIRFAHERGTRSGRTARQFFYSYTLS